MTGDEFMHISLLTILSSCACVQISQVVFAEKEVAWWQTKHKGVMFLKLKNKLKQS